jgi:hypothetical protein
LSSEPQNPIDAFVLARLKAEGLTFSPPAAPHELLRRMSLDLRGFPPTVEELEAGAIGDCSDDWRLAERVAHNVDRYLADPAYGERWARHWLDLVRYADSNGYERDGPKPSIWRYRDWVIESLNSDKPFNRFAMEQIAADELPDSKLEDLRAMGFFAVGTWQDEVDPLEQPQYRADELDDLVRTTSQAFLGITLGCARCHNHKFDPLTMTDYYSFAAILSPMKRPNQGRTDRDLPLGTAEQIAAESRRDAAIGELQQQIAELEKTKPAGFEQQVATFRERQNALRQATPDLPRVYRLFEDSAAAPPTHLLLSGRASNPGPVMQPGVPVVLSRDHAAYPGVDAGRNLPGVDAGRNLPGVDAGAKRSTHRRLALARWIASPENPLTARVIVNRVWQHHFGTGLVATSSDFGEKGARPTHPELLDWLAHWFMHDANWSLKKLHRLILTSRTYQQSAAISDWGSGIADSSSGNSKSEIRNPQSVDPENKLLWHFPYRRLDVEAIRDSILATAGNLDRRMYGPAVFLPIQAAAIEAHTDKQAAWQESPASEHGRRTVYAYVKRTLLVPMLETLDFCDTTNSTERRAVTSVAPQALTLFNGDFVNLQAKAFAQRLEREAGADVNAQLDLAYRAALSRRPTEEEMAAMLSFLQAEAAAGGDAHAALVQLCRVILNLNEFVYPN